MQLRRPDIHQDSNCIPENRNRDIATEVENTDRALSIQHRTSPQKLDSQIVVEQLECDRNGVNTAFPVLDEL